MKEENANRYLIPYSKFGKWSIIFILLFGLSLIVFYVIVDSGQRGGEDFLSNLRLAIPVMLAAIFGITSFIVGLIAAIKQKERSIFVFISIIIGFVVLLWTLAYIIPFE